ncbi:CLAVATA3/ESR (CLE)-related protein 17 [Raphanus sativus]|uniref:CLAVATA3/ESR (CLE)-related protein 17 n=1 Tax=Raphanus sativus TaxID=3726 RepID=W6E8S1_RAPSA|nr:CLAVATA3/ESR (CLE)-related protein 17 [Raphanus sativus]AHJ09726.1 CLE17 protein [Raphanus sativus]
MTQVLVRRETQGRKLRRWDVKTICFFFFFVIFQISYSSSASVASRRHHFVSSPPRKNLVYATSPFRGPLSREDNIYGDDKRVVRTGPNPLHN